MQYTTTTYQKDLLDRAKDISDDLCRSGGRPVLWRYRYLALLTAGIELALERPAILMDLEAAYKKAAGPHPPFTRTGIPIITDVLCAIDLLCPEGWSRSKVSRLLLFAPLSDVPGAFDRERFLSHIDLVAPSIAKKNTRIPDEIIKAHPSKKLTPAESLVLEMRQGGSTLEEVGGVLKLSRQRIHQIQKAILKKLERSGGHPSA